MGGKHGVFDVLSVVRALGNSCSRSSVASLVLGHDAFFIRIVCVCVDYTIMRIINEIRVK